MAAHLIGSIGVGLILMAFAALHFRRASTTGPLYLLANAAGAGLACISSAMIGFLPFVILEGTWCAIAVGGLVHRPRRKEISHVTKVEPKPSCASTLASASANALLTAALTDRARINISSDKADST